MTTAQTLAEALGNAEQRPEGWYCTCPVHADASPSLCITEKDGRLLWNCRTGCNQAAVTAAVLPILKSLNGTEPAGNPPSGPRVVAEYDYRDEAGTLLYQVVRLDPKSFRQRRPDPEQPGQWIWKVGKVRQVLYRLPELAQAAAVIIVEGERDVEALRSLDIPATTNAGGAGKWKPAYNASLAGKRIAIIADADPPGHAHGHKVAHALADHATSVRLLECPDGHKDVADWIKAGAQKADISTAIRSTPLFTPTTPPPQPTSSEWPHGLLVSDKGAPLALLANAMHALRAHPALSGTLSFDTFAQRIVITKETPWHTAPAKQWTDRDDALLAEYLQIHDIRVGADTAATAASAVAHEHPHDSLTAWLRSLTWDNAPRLHTVAAMLGAPDPLSAELLRLWMISAVARAMLPGCQADYVIVLEGPQGARKSTALRVLFDPLERGWFRDDLPPLNSKDAQLHLAGAWCIEISELEAVNSRRIDLEHVKAFLTRRIDVYRTPYGRRVQDFPRRVVFAGSTNDAEYLKDSTGNRRWWPVPCGSIDTGALAAQRSQLWAQAVAAYDMQEQWWLDEEEEIARIQEQRRSADPWETDVLNYLRGRNYVTMEEVYGFLKVPIERRTQTDANRIARILRNVAGWHRKQMYNGSQRWWAYVVDKDLTWQTVTGQQQQN